MVGGRCLYKFLSLAKNLKNGHLPSFHSFIDTVVSISFPGISPLMWNPIAQRFGRQPIFLISTLGSCVCGIDDVFCSSHVA